MIVVKLRGGLGNQLFQYAFGRIASRSLNTELTLDCFEINRISSDDGILNFGLSGKFVNKSKLRIRLLRFKLIKYIFDLITFSKLNELRESEIDNLEITQLPRNAIYSGDFQRWEHVEKFLELNKVIKLNYQSEAFDTMVQNLESADPIVIHMRRGDYLQSNDWGLLSWKYYSKVIEILDKSCNQEIWIFSDSINLVKKEFLTTLDLSIQHKLKHRLRWFGTDLGLTAAETMILMSNTKRLGIGNSTFSLWAGYLTTDCKVVAPKDFYLLEPTPNMRYPNSWIVIESEWQKA
jgi:hypothetical protein